MIEFDEEDLGVGIVSERYPMNYFSLLEVDYVVNNKI
jgi:hypothetical protein